MRRLLTDALPADPSSASLDVNGVGGDDGCFSGRTPVQVAIDSRHWAAAEALLAHGAQLSIDATHDETMLHAAAAAAERQAVAFLVSHGVAVNARDASPHTLDVAACRLPPDDGAAASSPVAASQADAEWRGVVSYLLRNGGRTGSSKSRDAFLLRLVGAGAVDLTTLLLDHDGEVEPLLAANSSGRSCIHLAAVIGAATGSNGTALLEVLLERGGRTDLTAGDGATPLHAAAAAGHVGSRVLIKAGARERARPAREHAAARGGGVGGPRN